MSQKATLETLLALRDGDRAVRRFVLGYTAEQVAELAGRPTGATRRSLVRLAENGRIRSIQDEGETFFHPRIDSTLEAALDCLAMSAIHRKRQGLR